VAKVLAEGLVAESQDAELVTFFSWTPMRGVLGSGFREVEYTDENGVVLLDLTRGAEQLFKEFSQTRRNDVRKAINLGVEVSPPSSEEDLVEFYEIYRDWSDAKGIPYAPYDVLIRALKLTKNRLVLLARHEGRIVAGSVFRFHPGGMFEYSANSSRRKDASLKPNDLLCWRGIEWSCENGFTLFSMGGANLFRRKFGGWVHTCYRYRKDLTLLRRHDRKDTILRSGLRAVLALPSPMRDRILRAVGRQP